jgi:dolichol kinase
MSTAGNLLAFFITTAICVGWVEICKALAQRKLLLTWQRRKLLHILTGPLFIATFPLFTNDFTGSIYAAAVPIFMTLKFICVGLGIIIDEDMVLSASRNNDRLELLKGPTLYGCIFVLVTLIYWKSVQSVMCLFILCFGDGFAEICGRNFGQNNKLFYSKDKSFAGYLGFVLFSLLFTTIFLFFYGDMLFGKDWWENQENAFLFERLIVDCIFAGFIETFPIADFDNLTVFGAAVLCDNWLLKVLKR